MTIWRREKSGEHYYSIRETKADTKKTDALDVLGDDLDDDVREALLKQYRSEAADGQEVEISMDSLTRITKRYKSLNQAAVETQEARVEATLAALQMEHFDELDTHLEKVRDMSGKPSWKTIMSWCVVRDKKGKPTSEYHIKDKSILQGIDKKIKEAAKTEKTKKTEETEETE